MVLVSHQLKETHNMEQALIEYMEEELGIFDHIFFDLETGTHMYEDVGGNVWTLQQIEESYKISLQFDKNFFKVIT